MDSARHIALIDELCSRLSGTEHGSSRGVGGTDADGVTVLRGSHGLRGGDPAERATTVERYEWQRDALAGLLTPRWGEAGLLNLQTVLLRGAHEEIPEPWAALSVRARVAYVWQVPESGGWAAVAVADRDEEDEVQLLAAVTATDPP
ncbi:hypothetical protein [Streptomyces sp. CRN 30]|uniref:hypothetical protein n=1 Tax=Streptomyces sp. CRN 30 TaxID=3075613 RepID=UPI002A7FAC40|nr:hypothetical protein [Streptomyces sp. CRN 30]